MKHFSKSIRKSLLVGTLIIGASLLVWNSSINASDKKVADMSEKELGSFIADYLIDNPSIVIEALQAYEIQQEESQKAGFKDKLAKHSDFIFNNDMSPVIGNKDGDVTIVEFFDYNCGYCRRAMEDVVKLLEEDKNVRVVFKELPILSESSKSAANYALASAKQGNDLYFKYHVEIMNFRGPKNEKNLEKIAKDVGLDVDQLKKDAQSREVRSALLKNLEMSRDLGVRGTPAFIIGEHFAPGYIGYDNLKKAIEAVRESK